LSENGSERSSIKLFVERDCCGTAVAMFHANVAALLSSLNKFMALEHRNHLFA